jgi:hypothetical protein
MRRAWVLVAVLLGGCGYRVTAANARLPRGITALRIPLFSNRTAEPDLEATLTQAFREHYARAGVLAPEATTARLEGTILAVSNPPILASPGRGPTYRLSLVVQVKLIKDEAVVDQLVVNQGEDFPSGADVLLTEANRGAALRRLAETVAREAAERLEAP